MKKILIIGQAPPAVQQSVPYDTTLLYVMLSWVGISQDIAQEMFEFEAVSNEFPGFQKSGHKAPTMQKMYAHYEATLKTKIEIADKVLVLGNIARDFLNSVHWKHGRVCYLTHPSKRNYSRIMDSKETIIKALKEFLN